MLSHQPLVLMRPSVTYCLLYLSFQFCLPCFSSWHVHYLTLYCLFTCHLSSCLPYPLDVSSRAQRILVHTASPVLNITGGSHDRWAMRVWRNEVNTNSINTFRNGHWRNEITELEIPGRSLFRGTRQANPFKEETFELRVEEQEWTRRRKSQRKTQPAGGHPMRVEGI